MASQYISQMRQQPGTQQIKKTHDERILEHLRSTAEDTTSTTDGAARSEVNEQVSGGKTVQALQHDLDVVWNMVNDLSEQLTTNNRLLAQLKEHTSTVKGQAVHTGVGFPLRRFNIDLTDEEFTTQLEEFASHLVLENQNLTYENKQLNILLKDYEGVLEGVMNKFRSVSHAATKHELALHRYYTSLLHSLRTAQSSDQLMDSTTLSLLSQRLSTLIRLALRNANGEDQQDEAREEWEALGNAADMVEGLSSTDNTKRLGSSAAGSIGSTSQQAGFAIPGLPSASHVKGTTTDTAGSVKIVAHHPPRAPSTLGYDTWQGDLTPSGGYPGTFGRPDWALEREGEIVRLSSENQMLREILGVTGDVDLVELTRLQKETEFLSPEIGYDRMNEEGAHGVGEAHEPDMSKGIAVAAISTINGKDESMIEQAIGGGDETPVKDTASSFSEQLTTSSSLQTADKEAKDIYSTSPKQSLSRLTLRSPTLTKHHTYAGIPTTATTPLSPSAIRDLSARGKIPELSTLGLGSNASASGTSVLAPPGLTTHLSTGALPSSTSTISGQNVEIRPPLIASQTSTIALSSLLLRPGSKTKTQPTTATSVGVSLNMEEEGSRGLEEIDLTLAKKRTSLDGWAPLKVSPKLPTEADDRVETAGVKQGWNDADQNKGPTESAAEHDRDKQGTMIATDTFVKPDKADVEAPTNESAILDDDEGLDAKDTNRPDAALSDPLKEDDTAREVI